MIFVVELTNNITLLLSLLFIYGLVKPRIQHLPQFQRKVVKGLIFGLFAVASMLTPFQVAPGIIYDGRSIILAIVAVFSGAIPGMIAAIMVSLYRLSLGGVGAPMGVGAALSIVAAGLLIRAWLARRNLPISARWLLLLGIIAGLLTIFWSSLVPSPLREEVLEAVTVPLLILFPLGTLLASLLFQYVEWQVTLAESLRESEGRYRTVIAAMAEGVIVRYEDDTPDTMNEQARRLLEPVAEPILQRADLPPDWSIIREDGTPMRWDEYSHDKVMRTGLPARQITVGLRSPDWRVKWFTISAQALIKAGESQPYGVVATFSDITAERQTKEQLANERNLLRTLIDNIPDYIFIKDSNGRFVMSNLSHASAAKLTPNELVGKSAFDTFPPELAAQFDMDDQSVLVTGESLLNIERTSVHADGSFTTMLTNKIPLKSQTREIAGLIGVSRDITDRKRLEQQTMELAAERERMSLLRKFIRDVSHDFKTPLSVINTSVYLMQKVTDPVRQQEHIAKLEMQAAHLTKLFDDFLTMTNLDSAAYPLNLQPMDVNHLVVMMVDQSMPLALQKGQRLTLQPYSNLPLVEADMMALQQALSNVIVNALTYTPDGGKVTVRIYEEADEVIIEVADTGLGIHADDLPKIFDRLYRADEARSTETGGAGLGLSIAKQIMKAHGGTITVKSTPGEGSIFWLHLPLKFDKQVDAMYCISH